MKQLLREDLPPARLTKAVGSVETLHILIKGDPAAIRQAVRDAGGLPGATAGDITSARVPLHSLLALTRHPDVLRIEHSHLNRSMNDRAAARIGARFVQNGVSPLPGPFTGAGVIVGIIDTGIDFRHRDFRGSEDSTQSRILALWDQESDAGANPAGFAYGSEWNREQIEAALAGSAAVAHADSNGHGTHVAGTAAGNGRAVGHYKGMAPGADLVVVRGLQNVVDAAAYIFEQADKLGVPAVINFSAGNHQGPHDGSALEDQAIDALVDESAGRVFVASASNDGSAFLHWGGFDLEPDSLWTYYHTDLSKRLILTEDDAFIGAIDIVGTLEASAEGETFIAVGMDTTRYRSFRVERLGYHGRTPYHSLRDLLDASTSLVDTLYYNDGSASATVEFSASRLESGKVQFLVTILDSIRSVDFSSSVAVGADLFRLILKGSGELHAWSDGSLTGSSATVRVDVFDDRYRPADNRSSIASPASATKVLAAGASTNAVGGTGVEGALAGFSGRGPTVDGRIKPDIVAPGDYVTSSKSADAVVSHVTQDGRHFTVTGTSFAAPMVTGAVALYLERHPGAIFEEVRSAFVTHAFEDEFTGSYGSLPNPHWGYGKLDVLAALTGGAAFVEPLRALEIDTVRVGDRPGGRLFSYAPTAVFFFELGAPQDVSIDLSPNFDAVLSLYGGSTVRDLREEQRIQTANFGPGFEFIHVSLLPGPYLIAVSSYLGGEARNFNLDFKRRFFQTRALSLRSGEPTTGTLETGLERHIYLFTLANAATVRIELNSAFDAFLGLFTDTALSEASRLAGIDDGIVTESITRSLGAGTYALAVNTNDVRGFGEYTIELNELEPEPPEIDASAARSDFDDSGRVDFSDFLAFASSFGARSGNADYDDRMDFDRNGRIDFSDFLEFAGDFGARVR